MNEKIKSLISLFTSKPYVSNMGAGRISKWQKCSVEEVKEAKKIYYNIRNNTKPNTQNEVKILLLDIETAPLRAYVWSRWKQNIYLGQTISEWFMLCWSAKWLGEDTVYSARVTGEEALTEDDSSIIKPLWDLLNEADILIAHNGKTFDIPKINTRFIINGLPPTTPYKQIDTMEVAKKQFGFSSNKLDNLAILFGFDRKLETGFELWKECMEGKEESLAYMEEYNRYDVILLEKVYLKLRPYIKNHPNLGVYTMCEENQCGHCASKDLTFTGYTYTNTGKYSLYKCNECGAISRTRITSLSKNKRNNLLTTLN